MVDSTMDNNIVSVVVFYNLCFTVIKFTVIKKEDKENTL